MSYVFYLRQHSDLYPKVFRHTPFTGDVILVQSQIHTLLSYIYFCMTSVIFVFCVRYGVCCVLVISIYFSVKMEYYTDMFN